MAHPTPAVLSRPSSSPRRILGCVMAGGGGGGNEVHQKVRRVCLSSTKGHVHVELKQRNV